MLIVLPLPPKILHPNGRTQNYRYRSAMVKQARGDARLATMAVRNRVKDKSKFEQATLRATFYVRHHQSMDDDGLIGWCKAYRDGIADALGIDDKHITTLRPVLVNGDGNQRVEIEIENAT